MNIHRKDCSIPRQILEKYQLGAVESTAGIGQVGILGPSQPLLELATLALNSKLHLNVPQINFAQVSPDTECCLLESISHQVSLHNQSLHGGR